MLLKWTAAALVTGAAISFGSANAQDSAASTPPGDQPAAGGRVEAATQGLDIDDATRSRYRWHNGEWWFKTQSGQWKYHRDGQWNDFDPTTFAPRTGARPSVTPRTYSSDYDNRGTYDNRDTYARPRPYAYRSDQDRYDGRYYGGSRNYDGRYDGRYYDPQLNNGGIRYGTGYRGYDPGTDRYYGRGAYGQPYSVSGDRYRGGVIGSEIGGRIGGQAGAVIGGAIGADAAD